MTVSDIVSRTTSIAALTLVAVLGVPGSVAADPPAAGASQAVQDAWIDGRLSAAYALNEALKAFEIDTRVNDGVVRLSGTVESDIDRELAGEIAAAVEGVRDVENSLTVEAGAPTVITGPTGDNRSFGQRISDATATARVKRSLDSNGKTKGLPIEVETENDVIILRGAVASRTDKMLAEMIARNTDGIDNVRNQLEIDEQT